MSTPAKRSWKSRVAHTWPYATAAVSVMFVPSALFAWFVSWQAGAEGIGSYILATTDPAVTSIVMLLLCILVPELYAGKRFGVHHILALPTVFLSIVFGMKSLAQSSGAGIRTFAGAQRFDFIWLDVKVLFVAWIILVVVMSMARTLIGEKEGVN